MPLVTTYARVGELRVAYSVEGEGPPLVLAGSSFTNHEALLNDPSAAMFFEALERFCTLVRFDVVGVGNSDRPESDHEAPPVGDQLEAVLDASRVGEATLLGLLQGGQAVIEFAVRHPDRVTGLILWNSSARMLAADDYDIGLDPRAYDQFSELMIDNWGTEWVGRMNAPSRADDPRWLDWYVRYVRSTATPRQVRLNLQRAREDDVRALLPDVKAPTLVLARRDYAGVPSSHGRYLAAHIPDAEFVEIPGGDGPMFWETPELIVTQIERFVTGGLTAGHSRPETLTLLFTDIVGSTEMAARRGDSEWAVLLSKHDDIASKWVGAYSGRIVSHTGDGVLAEFPSASLALAAAASIRDGVREIGLGLRQGVHTAEVERKAEDLSGLGVVVARRVMEAAEKDEILVSSTVHGVVVGSKLEFEDAGDHVLKGLRDPWQLFRLIT